MSRFWRSGILAVYAILLVQGCVSSERSRRPRPSTFDASQGFNDPENQAPALTRQSGTYAGLKTVSQKCDIAIDAVIDRPPDHPSARTCYVESPSFTIVPTREPLGRAPPTSILSN